MVYVFIWTQSGEVRSDTKSSLQTNVRRHCHAKCEVANLELSTCDLISHDDVTVWFKPDRRLNHSRSWASAVRPWQLFCFRQVQSSYNRNNETPAECNRKWANTEKVGSYGERVGFSMSKLSNQRAWATLWRSTRWNLFLPSARLQPKIGIWIKFSRVEMGQFGLVKA